MMFASLRSRLWLSYTVLVAVSLFVVSIGIFWTIQRSPLLYRQTVLQMRLTGAMLVPRLQTRYNSTQEQLERFIYSEAEDSQLRLAIIKTSGTVQVDSGDGRLPLLTIHSKIRRSETDGTYTFWDLQGNAWLYTLCPIDRQNYLMIVAKRPRLTIRVIFRDDVLAPIFLAGTAALALAFLLGWGIARWITNPLQRMSNVAHLLAKGENRTMPVEGPQEVQKLAQAFNYLIHKVQISQQSQRDFVANVSHELKTPITSIQGFAQAMLDGTADSPVSLRQAAQVIYDEAGRMYRLVMDLLSLAKLEAGTANLKRDQVDLDGLLNSIVKKFQIRAEQNRVELCTQLAPIQFCIGDGDRLAQVFTNLIDNALKYSPTGSKVTISLDVVDNTAMIQVADNGIGIAKEDQRRIFERFYQIEKSRRGGPGRGVGLGLPIARQIVLAHSGDIWVESELGKGSTFVVKLPLIRPDDPTLVFRKNGI